MRLSPKNNACLVGIEHIVWACIQEGEHDRDSMAGELNVGDVDACGLTHPATQGKAVAVAEPPYPPVAVLKVGDVERRANQHGLGLQQRVGECPVVTQPVIGPRTECLL